MAKSPWSGVGDLRKPNVTWRIGGAERWWAKALGSSRWCRKA
jgi:hypothetical protein